MPNDQMTICEHKRRFKIGESYEWRWKVVAVSEIVGTPDPQIRCAHCHGAVRIHKQQVDHGPQDHVEHRSRQDSKGCRAGHYFQGEHRISARPVS
jgi:hypothetical protein